MTLTLATMIETARGTVPAIAPAAAFEAPGGGPVARDGAGRPVARAEEAAGTPGGRGR